MSAHPDSLLSVDIAERLQRPWLDEPAYYPQRFETRTRIYTHNDRIPRTTTPSTYWWSPVDGAATELTLLGYDSASHRRAAREKLTSRPFRIPARRGGVVDRLLLEQEPSRGR
jgi:hypothetical protein